MKKNDIIAQKLFETCKLSEFYLNLLKHDDESPMQLAHAYKQKLYEIVERYDRLLEANKQRQELNLELLETNSTNSSKFKPKNLALSKTSTPNKSMSALNTPLNGQMPISVLTSSSSTNLPPNSNCSTPATTPGHSSIKSSLGMYARGSTRSIYSQAYQQHHYSNKQMPNFSYLYADTTDESDVDEEDEAEDFYDYKTNSNTLKCQLEYDSYRTSGNEINNNNDSKKNVETNSESDNEEKCVETNNNSNLLNLCSQNIEKSYSNLSKDSGVFGESYHSECSNHLSGIGHKQNITISDHDQNESCEDRISDEDNNTFEENLTSPTASSSSSNNNYSREETNFHSTETSTPKSKPPSDLEPETTKPSSFIWGSVTRLVEDNPSSTPSPPATPTILKPITPSKFINDYTTNLPARPTMPVKPKFFLNKLSSEHNINQSQSLLKNSLLKQTNNYQTITKNPHNYNVDIDNTNMMSMMVEPSNTTNQNNQPEPSPNQSLTNESVNSDQTKASPFIFNYNSLMNVSMLDNIQATNTNNSEVDNMNCSILMFN